MVLSGPVAAMVGPGGDLPTLNLPDADGGRHDLNKSLKGNVSLIIYWSVSCPYCRKYTPGLLELARRYDGNPFKLILINCDGPAMAPAAKAYARKNGLPGPVILDSGPDDAEPLAEALDLDATPTVIVVNSQGKITALQELNIDIPAVEKAGPGRILGLVGRPPSLPPVIHKRSQQWHRSRILPHHPLVVITGACSSPHLGRRHHSAGCNQRRRLWSGVQPSFIVIRGSSNLMPLSPG